jgi:hypothetical protein
MTSESVSGTVPLRLLDELVQGSAALPPARERWIALLTHRSPSVRLAAEVALMELVRSQPLVPEPSAPEPPAARVRVKTPHHVPPFGFGEPKRHCRRCLGHDFWVDVEDRLHCDHCEPLPTV